MDENSFLLKIRKYIGPLKNGEIDKNSTKDLLSLLNLYVDGQYTLFLKKIDSLKIVKKIENDREYKIFAYKFKKRFLNYEIDLSNKFYCHEKKNFFYLITKEKLETVKNLKDIQKFNFENPKSDLLKRRIKPDISIDEYVSDLLSTKKYREDIRQSNEKMIEEKRVEKFNKYIRDIEIELSDSSESSNYEIRDAIRDENKKGNILRKG